MLSTAESRALAAMELAVRIDLNDLPQDLMSVVITIPDEVTFYQVQLVKNWDRHPPDPDASVLQGKVFVESAEALAMRVPSVVIRGDYNYLINPAHKLFNQIEIIDMQPFRFDERLSGERVE